MFTMFFTCSHLLFLYIQVSIKTDPSDKNDEMFAAWRSRKDSMAKSDGFGGLKPPDAQSLANRRKSRMATFGKGLSDIRRLTMNVRAKSDVSADNLRPQIQKENTYKMVPDEGSGFSVAKVRDAVAKLLEDECTDLTYDQDISSKLTCILAERIKDKVKELGFNRHKIAVNLIVGQVGDQGIEVASRCCWNPATDNYSCVTYKNKTMMVVALIYGMYFE